MKNIKKIQRALQSFSDAGAKSVAFSDAKFDFINMNSMYVTHQHVTVDLGHGYDDVIILDDYIVLKRFECEKEENSFSIPASWVKNALAGLPVWDSFPAWFQDAKLLSVYMPDRFKGYDDETGKPIWDVRPVNIESINPVRFHFDDDNPEDALYED
ncbi:MAG: hypothetical protein P8Y70_00310 [Candidatus Lokiarchaeota archaeon]